MSERKAGAVWKELKPFAMDDLAKQNSKSSGGETGDYSILLYRATVKKISKYSVTGSGLQAALAAASSGDVVFVPAGSISPSEVVSYSVGSEISTGSIPVTNDAGTEITGLTIGNWYAVECTGGPWDRGAGFDPEYTFRVSNDGGTTWEPADNLGLDFDDVWHLDEPTWGAHVEAVDSYHVRLYFQATTTSIYIRVGEDATWGDNSGSLGWKLSSASVGTAATIPSGVELVGLTKNSIINGDVENNGKITNITVTGTITGTGQYLYFNSAGLLITNKQINSEVTTGTAPFAVDSETAVANLNADMVDGQHIPKLTYDATAAPTVNEDSGDGYSVGSAWYDVTNDKAYVCLDASVGAAVWQEIGGGGASALDDLTDVNEGTPSDGDVLTYDATAGEWISDAPSGGNTWSVQEDHSSLCNGSRVNFSTSDPFLSNTTMIFLNGVLQRPGAANDYEEDAGLNGITFNTAPLTGDSLLIAYIVSGTGATTTSITDLYIDATSGNDTTGAGTAGSPYATLEKALSVLPNNLNAEITIHVADGTYTEGIDIQRFLCHDPNKLIIEGNTTTPANVVFTGTITRDAWDTSGNTTFGCVISGGVNVKLSGIKINVTSKTGILIIHHAYLALDRCIVTGTIDIYGVRVTDHATLELNGNNTISGVEQVALHIGRQSHCNPMTAGTLTITGEGATSTGIYVGYSGLMFCGWASGIHIAITEVKFGILARLGGVFQHYSPTGSITIDNTATISGSIACDSADASTWSTDQAITIDHFATAFHAYCVAYIEAVGSRTITNVSSTSSASLGGVVNLP